MKAHANDPSTKEPFIFDEPRFEMRSSRGLGDEIIPDIVVTCTYCGSMTIDDVIKYMQISGTEYSGSDWKYGWPHKFYFEIPCEPFECVVSGKYAGGQIIDPVKRTLTKRHQKFYAEHMRDATAEQLRDWNKIVGPLLGIKYDLDVEKGLGYRAPRSGYQAHGVIS